MFGVIICPRCNRARGVDLSVKTSKCPGCGLHSEVDRMHTYFQTDNELELAEAVRRTSSRMQQSIEDYGDDVVQARQAAEEQRKKAKNQSLDFDGMVLLARSISSESGFGPDELKEALAKEGYDLDPVKIASVMLNEGIVYEPRPGRFRPL
jgi:hypothetical protein